MFKLDEPVSEIFKRMREMSNNVLKDLKAHPYYLTVSKSEYKLLKNGQSWPKPLNWADIQTNNPPCEWVY